jgi:hypothetical protein
MIIINANVRGRENDNPQDLWRHNSLSNICLFLGGCMNSLQFVIDEPFGIVLNFQWERAIFFLYIIRWLSSFSFILFDAQADWWKRNGSETHFYRLFIVSELIFIFLNWWKRNGSNTYFLSAFHGGWLGLHLLELTASRSTERQINVISLYFSVHTRWLSFFLCHDDEVIYLLAHFFSEEAECWWPTLTRLSSIIHVGDI